MIIVKTMDGARIIVSSAEIEALKAALDIAQQCDDPDLSATIDSLIKDFTEVKDD